MIRGGEPGGRVAYSSRVPYPPDCSVCDGYLADRRHCMVGETSRQLYSVPSSTILYVRWTEENLEIKDTVRRTDVITMN